MPQIKKKFIGLENSFLKRTNKVDEQTFQKLDKTSV